MLCPCCSELPFEQCCQPLIAGQQTAPTPQALMRSRYSAYCVKAIDYIYDTYAQTARFQQNKADIKAWAQSVTFVGLDILACSDESQHDDKSIVVNNTDSAKSDDAEYVEFCARYLESGQLHQLHERSRFVKEQGQWRYIDGNLFPHNSSTPGRNDPCPCKSGKKFKKCHG